LPETFGTVFISIHGREVIEKDGERVVERVRGNGNKEQGL
jgi:hypothetical protein